MYFEDVFSSLNLTRKAQETKLGYKGLGNFVMKHSNPNICVGNSKVRYNLKMFEINEKNLDKYLRFKVGLECLQTNFNYNYFVFVNNNAFIFNDHILIVWAVCYNVASTYFSIEKFFGM